jgi:phosphomevalonate kinase
MAQLALTYGSFGDLLETAKLVVKVVRLLRANGRTKLSQERLALATKLQTLNSDLITLDSIAAGVHIDLSSTHTLLVVIRVRAEVEACRMVLTQFLDKLAAPRGFLGSMIVALSEESELARFKTEISSPMKVIRTLLSMLNLYIPRPFTHEIALICSA